MFDLNVPWPCASYTEQPSPQQLIALQNVIATLYCLGYTNIAINFVPSEHLKIPGTNPNPIDMGSIRQHFSRYVNLRIFSRITLIISDPTQCQGLSKLQNSFDIIAVQPNTEKALQTATTNLDVDLISFNLSSRLPFFLKHKTIGAAVEKGLQFELCYSSVIAGTAGYLVSTPNEGMSLSSSAVMARRVFFSNVMQLLRASRSNGVVVSSGAVNALQVRNGSDILNLLKTVGLDSSRAKACISDNPEKVLLNGRLRIKSNKQTVVIDNSNDSPIYSNDLEDPNKKNDSNRYRKRLDATSSGRLLKKQRMAI